MHLPPGPAPVGILAPAPPPWLHDDLAGVRWYASTAEAVVAARSGWVRGFAVDGRHLGVDVDVVRQLQCGGPVLVLAPEPDRARWEAGGAAVAAHLPPTATTLVSAIEDLDRTAASVGGACGAGRAGRAGRADRADRADRAAIVERPAPLVSVLAAAGGSGAAAAMAIARSLAQSRRTAGGVLLADLTLDGALRALHGVADEATGLPELISASRFGAPSSDLVAHAVHATGRGYAVVPGLREHEGWVSVGGRSARSALDGLRAVARLVVAHVDPDLEGEAETGSLDVEDRNVLARTAVGTSGVVVVVGGVHPGDRVTLATTVRAVRDFGVCPSRLIVLRSPERRVVRRWTRLQRWQPEPVASAPPWTSAPGDEPRPIEPGTLGHWGHDVAGWITPSVPQQP